MISTEVLTGELMIFVFIAGLFGLLYLPAWRRTDRAADISSLVRKGQGYGVDRLNARDADTGSREYGDSPSRQIPASFSGRDRLLRKRLLQSYVRLRDQVDRNPGGSCAHQQDAISLRVLSILETRYYS